MGSKSERSGRSRAWTALALVAGAALVWGFWATLDRFLAAGESVAGAPARAARELAAAARGLVTADVTERFVSSLPVAHGAARLELATAETVETISRSDERRAFWDLVPLGTTTVEIRVPVTWRWHVPLDGDWSVVVEEGVLTVDAPPLRPSLPPAIHTDGIERRVESDWLRFDGGEQLARLERELTPLLSARAAAAPDGLRSRRRPRRPRRPRARGHFPGASRHDDPRDRRPLRRRAPRGAARSRARLAPLASHPPIDP